MKITNDSITEIHNKVLSDPTYGREGDIVSRCFNKFPLNNDVDVVAMKIGIIDITNSTHVSQHKSKISVYELAEHICSIKDIDKRIENGDPTVVNEIARCNGKINLFSFATKYCCNHNFCIYHRDDYSILDTIVKKNLPKYFNDIKSYQIQKWQDNIQYEDFNNYINKKLDELNITTEFRKRKLDHFIWYLNK